MDPFLAKLLVLVVASVILWPVRHFLKEVLQRNAFDDPVYKKNVQKLIERNRRFEDSKE
jgi:hypothetical protein